MYMYIYLYVYVCNDSAAAPTSTCAYTRTQTHQARGATPKPRRVADTTSHGLSAGRQSTQVGDGRNMYSFKIG